MLLNLLLSISFGILSNNINYSLEKIDDNTQELTVKFALGKENYLYKDSIDFSIDSPDFKLSDWATEQVAVQAFDKNKFKDNRSVYNKNTTVRLKILEILKVMSKTLTYI